ncbi:MAG: DUF4258 domain-containing protein [Polyangia bacterium]
MREFADQLSSIAVRGQILYTRHARIEMEQEELGIIGEAEVFEALTEGRIIEYYDDDEPYPSCLVFGKTKLERPLHVVAALALEEETIIVVTVYQPDPERWIGFERRRR